MFKPPLQLVRLKQWSIFRQLQLEEALLRADNRNWCLLNEGVSPAIVMGVSGKPEELLNEGLLKRNPIPVIRRFSGGGTVFVDENTIFVCLICNKSDVNIPSFPKQILCWTRDLYQPVFDGVDFGVEENDYVVGDLKFGGNAQYLSKNRWLHHSTLLWDFSMENMNYLKLPSKMPGYRRERNHQDFLCKLSDHLSAKEDFYLNFTKSLSQKFNLRSTSRKEMERCLSLPHRKSTVLLTRG